MAQKYELLWEIKMAQASFSLFVLYGQISVFLTYLQQPFNDWLQKHSDQGFSWRLGSASFRTLEESGQHLVSVEVSKKPVEISEKAIRVIEVPFEVPENGSIEVAAISESFPLTISSGIYNLRCEFFAKSDNGIFPVRLVFISTKSPQFKVVRADEDIVLQGDLLIDANPAQLLAAKSASAYSVAFETSIAKVGAGTRASHFTDANKALTAAMNDDAALAKMMDELGVNIERLDRSPAGWSWHHVPDQPGVMQLVPRAQHQGSSWQSLLHPDQVGGFKLWGFNY